MEGIPTLVWVLVPAVVLAHAALSDIRSREISDAHWVLLGAIGSVCCAWVSAEDAGLLSAVCVMSGSMVLLAYMLTDFPRIAQCAMLLSAAVLFAIPIMSDPDSGYAWAGAASAVMFFLFYAMYEVGLLQGGADAKCLMAVALAFPVYPMSEHLPVLWDVPYPASLIVNPSFSVMTIALVMSLAGALCVLVRNLVDGDVGPRMLTTYRMPVAEARDAFVWPAERMSDGVLVPCRGYLEKSGILDELEDAGIGEVRVTPMLPFVLPLAVSFVAVMVIGSPLAALIGARGPPCVRSSSTCPRPDP